MRIDVQAIPKFNLVIDKETVADLIACSAKHYDATCRNASADYDPRERYRGDDIAGFLRVWERILANGFTDGVSANWSQLDLLLKCCEQGRTERLGHFTVEVMRALHWAKNNIYTVAKDDVTAYARPVDTESEG